MAKTIGWLAVGVLVGVVLMYGQKYFLGEGDGSTDSGGEDPSVAIGNGPGARLVGSDSPQGSGSRPANPVSEGVGSDAESTTNTMGNSARPVPALPAPRVAYHTTSAHYDGGGGLTTVASRAEDALARGNTDLAISLLRGLVSQALKYPNADFSSQAFTLLRIDQDPRARRDSLLYLQQKGVGAKAFEEQLTQATILATSADSDSLVRAWDELTIAYEAALDPRQRDRVVSILKPYIDRMVFSRRVTPLLKKYTVQPGDTLLKIAIRYGTTVDAIQRLNNRTTDKIQPRTSLLILPGRVRIHVDKSDFRLWATVDDKVFLHFDVGLGQGNSTPEEAFLIRVKIKDPEWYPPGGGGRIPAGDPRNILGSRWLGFQDTKEHFGFGIHATDNRNDIGRESSSGCIRLLTEEMELLYDFIPRGTQVVIAE